MVRRSAPASNMCVAKLCRNLVLAEDGRQRALPLREWNVVRQIRPSECLNEEKPQSAPSLLDGARGEYAANSWTALYSFLLYSGRTECSKPSTYGSGST